MRVWLFILLILPQLALARVYLCVDEQTGETSFTDRACPDTGRGEEVRVNDTNIVSDDSESSPSKPKEKTWNSERDRRKTGLDYNAQRRSLYQNRATAQSE